jgi:SAM-dependent methyltransferase
MTAARAYDRAFLQYTARSSAYAARAITARLAAQLAPASVLDVGCAAGTWLHAWTQAGVADIHGIDGDHVDRDLLEIPGASFTPVDLNAPFDLGRRFDLVQSLEVAEHLDASTSNAFAECLARHAGRYVLFSAAPPGQGGENHINERPYEFWRERFEGLGFATLDAVRPAIAHDARISTWYRYNTLLFVRDEIVPELEPGLGTCRVPPGRAIADLSPLGFRIRKALVRRLPSAAQHAIARLKARVFPTGRF